MTSAKPSTGPFFLLAFAFTWGLQAPGVLASWGVLPGNPVDTLPLSALGILGPAVAAIVLTRREGGWGAVRTLVAPILRWRAPLRWYVAALLPAPLLSLGLFALSLAGRQGPVGYLPAAAALGFGVVVSVAEEVGWRGYALPRLAARWGSFAAGGLLGVVWYVWHLPMFVGQGIPLDLALVMLLFFVGGSLLLTRIYDASGGSLLLVILGHLAAHLNNSHRALPGDVTPLIVHAIIYAAMGLFLMRGALPGGGRRRRRPTPTRSEAPARLDALIFAPRG